MGKKVELSKIVEKFGLVNLTPEVSYEDRFIMIPDINRPALQLTGFFAHFSAERLQIIGHVEHTYLAGQDMESNMKIYEKLFAYNIPGIVFCRNLQPDEMLLKKAKEANVPVFSTDRATSEFTAEIIRWLGVELAPCISIHGVLVEVYGIGVLIMGESGIGKSEAALELIKRGHRLVSDETLVGSAPDVTRHFIELRGIGIVDVKMLFGAQSVRSTQNIDLVITLEEWDKDKEYDRLGLEDQFTEFLGNKVVCHQLPIRPGRNLAIIVETAAINHRQKQMGYNAAQELFKRFQENMAKNKK